MKTRKLGTSELLVTELGLGCNNFGMRLDLTASRAVIHRALDLGITFFDTADVYGNRGGSETILGQVLGHNRKNIVLATKAGMPMDDAETMKGASPAYIRSSVEGSLRRLRTDWIDLYLIHQPDPETPIEETLKALHALIREGKVRYIGCSNFPAALVREALQISQELKIEGFVACQDEYSLLVRGIEQDLIPLIREQGLGLIPYFPLAGGLLTGKYRQGVQAEKETRFGAIERFAERFLTDANWKALDRLNALCKEKGIPLLHLAFGWLLANPAVSSVIAGATSPEQLEQNVQAIALNLSAEDLAEVDLVDGSK